MQLTLISTRVTKEEIINKIRGYGWIQHDNCPDLEASKILGVFYNDHLKFAVHLIRSKSSLSESVVITQLYPMHKYNLRDFEELDGDYTADGIVFKTSEEYLNDTRR